MSGARGPNVCTIAPGAPFLPTFARALIEGRVVAGFPDGADPLALSQATIYVPTRRAARALALEIARLAERPALVLPRIVPLGVMEGVEDDLLFDLAAHGTTGAKELLEMELPEAVGDMQRRLVLTRLVLAWSAALRGAGPQAGPAGRVQEGEGEPVAVAAAPAQAFHLAGDLAALMDEMIIEDLDWDGLRRLAPDDLARYWGVTLEFLSIASKAWPAWLEESGLVDRATRQVELVRRRRAQIEAGAVRDVEIVAGSTGANIATARLIAAIAHAPRGAIVLPGLDRSMDEKSWDAVAGGEGEPAPGHPQAAFRRLLPMIGVSRADVRELGEPAPALAGRMRFVSEAMRPAETTERWSAYRREAAMGIPDALAGLSLIEAADEREEALAIAIALREALETPEATAALVTPDRNLARPVRAELARWGVEIDDSGGDPLANAPLGVLARLALDCAQESCASAPLLALLRHPLTRLGFPGAELGRRVGDAEIALLRGGRPDLDQPQEAVAAARRRIEEDRFAHRALKALNGQDWDGVATLTIRLAEALAPLRALVGRQAGLATWVSAHAAAIDALTRHADGEEGGGEDQAALRLLLRELEQGDGLCEPLGGDDYAVFFESAAREAVVRRNRDRHPRLKSLGLLEARLMHVDIAVLAGLDETIWPPAARTDAFLSRPMRAELGLSAPERRIGQTAHDFVQALGAPRVILSRAHKRGGSPTTPSRFLQRLDALAGEAMAAPRADGARYLALARTLDRRGEARAIPRPEPRPPLDQRPNSLSVTRIETLRRDPYAIYAERILRLSPLDGLDEEEGARVSGIRIHELFARFQAEFPSGALPDRAGERLEEIAREVFAPQMADPEFLAFDWPRVQAICDAWLNWDAERRPDLAEILAEKGGRLEIALPDGATFTLTATADRIERRRVGAYAIVDFKTGAIPSQRMVACGLSPQMTLEAAMLTRGAFAGAPAGARVESALYVKLGGRNGLETREATKKDPTLAEAMDSHFAGLRDLIVQFRDPDTPYLPRPYPQFARASGPYDHLSRYREWSSGGGDET